MSRYLSYQKNKLSMLIIDKLKSNNLIVILEDSKRIMGNSALIQYNGFNIMYLNSELPDALKTYAILHEVGHLETKLLNNKFNVYNNKIENKVNRYALELIEPYIKKADYIMCILFMLLPEKYLYGKLLNIKELILEEEIWNKILNVS